MFFEDETVIQLCPTLCGNWMPVANQQKVMTPGEQETLYLLGAAEAKSGQFCGIISEKHRSLEFLGLVETMLEVWPDNELYVVMDNYIIHDSQITNAELQSNPSKYSRFHRVFLPTYSPWLNPIERFFRFMRRRLTHDYFFGNIEELKRAAINFFAPFAQPNETIRQIFSLV